VCPRPRDLYPHENTSPESVQQIACVLLIDSPLTLSGSVILRFAGLATIKF